VIRRRSSEAERSKRGSVGSPTLNALTSVGRRGSLISGSQPGYYESASFIAVLTLKTDF
jgi:hypothetical protein